MGRGAQPLFKLVINGALLLCSIHCIAAEKNALNLVPAEACEIAYREIALKNKHNFGSVYDPIIPGSARVVEGPQWPYNIIFPSGKPLQKTPEGVTLWRWGDTSTSQPLHIGDTTYPSLDHLSLGMSSASIYQPEVAAEIISSYGVLNLSKTPIPRNYSPASSESKLFGNHVGQGAPFLADNFAPQGNYVELTHTHYRTLRDPVFYNVEQLPTFTLNGLNFKDVRKVTQSFNHYTMVSYYAPYRGLLKEEIFPKKGGKSLITLVRHELDYPEIENLAEENIPQDYRVNPLVMRGISFKLEQAQKLLGQKHWLEREDSLLRVLYLQQTPTIHPKPFATEEDPQVITQKVRFDVAKEVFFEQFSAAEYELLLKNGIISRLK